MKASGRAGILWVWVSVSGSGVAAIFVGLLVATLLSRAILRSVGAATVAIKSVVDVDIAALALTLGRLAGGDLTARFASSRPTLKVEINDEIGELMKTYNILAAALSAKR